MLISDLQLLKIRIDDNLQELMQVHPYSKNVSKTICNLLSQDPCDQRIELWLSYMDEVLKEIVQCLEELEEEICPKHRAKDLKYKIDDNICTLKDKFPLVQNISEAITVLLDFDEENDLLKSWLRGNEQLLLDIETEIDTIQLSKIKG